jgi:hypothetical protein
MKSWITLLAICLVASALMVRPRQSNRAAGIVHADNTCDVTTLNSAYGYKMDGSFFDNQGYTNYLSAAGFFVADGQGNLSFKDTLTLDGGTTQSETYTGTYKMNSDCTGSLTANSPGAGVSLGFDFVMTANGNEMQMVNTNGTNITASAKKQVIVAATTPPTSVDPTN